MENETVFVLWRYEEGSPKKEKPGVWSIHKTMAGAEAEMRKYQTDGFICECALKE